MIALWLAALLQGQEFQQVRPILEASCLGCHGPQKALGNLRFDTAAGVAKAIVPGAPDKSRLLLSAERGTMPPGGPPLTAAQRGSLRTWIAAGAKWPEGVALGVKTAGKPDERATVEQLHHRIAASPNDPFQPYKTTIPGTVVSFEMVPIPGGEFTMGSAEEPPQRKVKLDPFWMASREVTWDEYRLFMFANLSGEKERADAAVDAISRPTRPYVEMSFGMGLNGYPAISMTQHAANKYAEWLSARTGRFYRLPTEAEWEYACRAGTGAVYSFGGDASKLGDYAWFSANSNSKYEKVGTKKPNPWGLYDMHGNVMEWTLDQYAPYAAGPAVMPWVKATRPYPHVARGGSWNDEPEALRCSARMASDPSWKMQDPQLPKSIWYLTDAQWLGFRLVRPVKVPSAAGMYGYWNSGVEKE